MNQMLVDNYKAVRSLETLKNYAVADLLTPQEPATQPGYGEEYYDDKYFWQDVRRKRLKWGDTVMLNFAALSEWVARVPGLYWSPDAGHIRSLAKAAIEYKSARYTKYHPKGKSQMVMGGVGTHKLPADHLGRRLCSLSIGLNASLGIPVLVYPDVWDAWQLAEGDVLHVEAIWTKTEVAWLGFDLGRGSESAIPRGYLELRVPEQILHREERNAPTVIHPYSVMEYFSGDVKLYDFVFAIADTGKGNYRRRLETFFDKYKDEHERFGTYLISADINDPLWDAEYNNPGDLRHLGADAKAKLELIEARVYDNVFDNPLSIDETIHFLVNHYDHDGLIQLAEYAGLPRRLWYTPAPLADLVPSLVQLAIRQKKFDMLLENAAHDHRSAFVAA